MSEIELSPEEQAVVMAMRQEPRSGKAIYRYAMRFNKDPVWDPDLPPWTANRSRSR